MAKSLEREVKLAAAPGFHLPDLNGVMDDVSPTLAEEGRLETTYHDTEDLRLARWGCSLRFRRGEGWTLKLPDSAVDEHLLSRSELTFAADGRRVPPAALALVRVYVRNADLRPVARLSTWRRKLRLLDGSGRELAEVVDDEVSVLSGRRVAARFREVEVELREGGDRILEPLLKRLAEAGAAPGTPIPKHVRALGPVAQEPPEVHPIAPGPGATVAAAIQAAIAASVQALLRHDPGIRVGGNAEDVHQARVGMRRLRSHLRLFRAQLEPAWATELNDEVRWLAAELGAVRDAEVLGQRLRGLAGELRAEDRATGLAIADRALAEVGGKRRHLLASLDSQRYFALVDRLVEAAHNPQLTGDPLRPASAALPDLARRPWERLRKAVRAAGRHPADETLHELRILTKRCRYAAEASAPVAGANAARFAQAAAGLQTTLGELQDSLVAQAWLRSAGVSGRRAFVAGELAQIEEARAQAAREGWRNLWKALARPRLREWLD